MPYYKDIGLYSTHSPQLVSARSTILSLDVSHDIICQGLGATVGFRKDAIQFILACRWDGESSLTVVQEIPLRLVERVTTEKALQGGCVSFLIIASFFVITFLFVILVSNEVTRVALGIEDFGKMLIDFPDTGNQLQLRVLVEDLVSRIIRIQAIVLDFGKLRSNTANVDPLLLGRASRLSHGFQEVSVLLELRREVAAHLGELALGAVHEQLLEALTQSRNTKPVLRKPIPRCLVKERLLLLISSLLGRGGIVSAAVLHNAVPQV